MQGYKNSESASSRQTVFIWVNIILLALAWYIAIHAYGTLPDKIPTHFDFKGYPNDWGQKNPYSFFLMPLVQSIIVLIIIRLRKYPHLYNFPRKREVRNWPEENRQPVYDFLSMFMLVVAFILNLTFIFIQTMIINTARTARMNSSDFFLMLCIVIVWIPLLTYLFLKINKIVSEQREALKHRVDRL